MADQREIVGDVIGAGAGVIITELNIETPVTSDCLRDPLGVRLPRKIVTPWPRGHEFDDLAVIPVSKAANQIALYAQPRVGANAVSDTASLVFFAERFRLRS